MASKFLHEAQRGASRGSIDLPLALLAGIAVGFVAFVMPADLLERAVQASGLPGLFPPAQPPLGTKAHGAFAVAAAAGVAALVYILLRMLGRTPAEAQPRRAERALEPETDPDAEPATPRLRRADFHPDAPARRPILATRDLGDPSPAAAPAPAPSWEPGESAPEPEEALDLDGPGIEIIEADEPEASEAAAVEPPEEAEPAAGPAVAAHPAARAERLEDASIAELMARLENGLARRLRQRAVAAAQAEPIVAVAPPAPPFAGNGNDSGDDSGDDRLRSAIENLQRMAARAR